MWVRIIISLFAGGFFTEFIFLVSGDITRPRSKDDSNFTLFYALIVFLMLSWLNKVMNREDKQAKTDFEKWKGDVSTKDH
jgi:hypothetical protein